jgi:uncharacterized phage protein (TIGR01671 family)
MREILFRCKRVDNGEWVEGCLYNVGMTYFIMIPTNRAIDYPVRISVIPETVGQFTALLDKNGVKIFEGDIIVSDFGDGDPNVIKFGQYKVFDEFGSCNSIGFYVFPENEPFGETIDENSLAYKVIGNIHDNPELITK